MSSTHITNSPWWVITLPAVSNQLTPTTKKSKPTFIFSNSGTSLLLVSLHFYYATLHVSLLVLTNNSNIGSRMIFARSHGLLSFTMHTKSSFVHFWLDLDLCWWVSLQSHQIYRTQLTFIIMGDHISIEQMIALAIQN